MHPLGAAVDRRLVVCKFETVETLRGPHGYHRYPAKFIPQRVHQSGKQTTIENDLQTTRVYLCSETLSLLGFADVVEEREGMFIPVEYKHGHQGEWLNDRIQLCAQAQCLEEMQSLKSPLPYGYIYYIGSRRRVRVDFREELRTTTLTAIAKAFQVGMLDKAPPPLDGKLAVRCPNCSLFPLCLPDEVKLLQSKAGELDNGRTTGAMYHL